MREALIASRGETKSNTSQVHLRLQPGLTGYRRQSQVGGGDLVPHQSIATGGAQRSPSAKETSVAVPGTPPFDLPVSHASDPHEQEAERVADQVMRIPAAEKVHISGKASDQDKLQRKCAECEDEEKHLLARAATGAGPNTAPPVVHEVLRTPGQPLDLRARAFMEPRFGHDFAKVRVHSDPKAASSARSVNASAYTVGNDIVFDSSRFNSYSHETQRLLAHELTHVVQQSNSNTPTALARKPAEGEQSEKKAAPKAPKCHTGCAQRWGQDTTCSKWGYVESVREKGEGKRWRAFSCCNTWPLSVEKYARDQFGINGAASCTAAHEREIATVTFGENQVQVLCSDTIPGDKFGETKPGAGACTGSIDTEVIEMSPKAMEDLSSQLANPLLATVCYSGSKENLCLHDGPGARAFPTLAQCLTRGCDPPTDAPSHRDSGWPRV